MFEDHHYQPYKSPPQPRTDNAVENYLEASSLVWIQKEGTSHPKEHNFNTLSGNFSQSSTDELCQSISLIQYSTPYSPFSDKQSFLSIILDNIHDAVILTDRSDHIVYLNPAAEKITGCSAEDYQGISIDDILIFLDKDNADLSTPKNIAWVKGKNNLSNRINFFLKSFYCERHEILGKALIFREAEDHQSLDNSLRQTNYDSLTGLMNRAVFENHLEMILQNTRQTVETHILCYLNLDRFKIINEICGHLTGDQFLREISRIIQKRVRKTDIISRLGGDEFGIILQNCTLEESQKTIRSLVDEVQKLNFTWQEHRFSFTVSIGICPINKDAHGHIELINTAKSACDIAKQNGRNRIHICQGTNTEITIQRDEIQWIPKIFKSLEDNNFKLYKQPIVSLGQSISEVRKKNFCCEILIRMQDKNLQVIAPGLFIPTAEKYGLMPMIDRWVVQNLFSYLRTNANDGFSLYMINLSGASLNDDAFLEFIEEKLYEFQIAPQKLCFEITETIAISNLAKTTHLIYRLKEMGCYFALDDFGSGMSSFGYLKNLPVDFLKIDGMFIKDIAKNQVAREIVEAINRVAHVMDIKTIAEYVEDEVTYQHLQQLDIDFAQGFGILKPSAL